VRRREDRRRGGKPRRTPLLTPREAVFVWLSGLALSFSFGSLLTVSLRLSLPLLAATLGFLWLCYIAYIQRRSFPLWGYFCMAFLSAGNTAVAWTARSSLPKVLWAVTVGVVTVAAIGTVALYTDERRRERFLSRLERMERRLSGEERTKGGR